MALIHGKKIKLFSLNSNRELAQEIANYVGVELSCCAVNRFADGEVQINIDETVRGHHVFVIQSTNKPVNENYMELFIMIDALKRRINEFKWYLNPLQAGTIQRELMKEFDEMLRVDL